MTGATPDPATPPPARPGPIGGDMAAVLHGLATRLRLPALTARHDATPVLAVFATVNGVLSIGVLAAAALATGAPFVFPSLGPTAFLLFYTPLQASASPRNTLVGHLVGVAAGYLSLVLFGLTHAGPAVTTGVTAGRVGAAALSLGLTSGAMVLLRAAHPPAGATTLIISLGILTEPRQLAVLMLAVALLVGQGLLINRLAGIPYPWWRPRPTSAQRPG